MAMETSETVWGLLPFPNIPESLLASPRRDRLAVVTPAQNRFHMTLLSSSGEQTGRDFEEIFPISLRFSPSGRLSFVAREGKHALQVVDGEVVEVQGVGEWDAISDEGGWGGDALAFVGKMGEGVHVVCGAQSFKVEGNLVTKSVRPSLDGKSVCWMTMTRRGLDFEWRIWRDGALWLEAKEVLDGPVWSSRGELACIFSDGQGYRVRVGEREFGPYSAVSKSGLTWSGNGLVCGWVVQNRGRAVVVRNGEELLTPVKTLRQNTLALSFDGSRYGVAAHVGLLGTRGALLCDGELGPSFLALGVTPPVWSRDGKIAYFGCEALTRTRAVREGRMGVTFRAFIDGSLTWDEPGWWLGCYAQTPEKVPALALQSESEDVTIAPEDGCLLRGAGKVCFMADNRVRDVGLRSNREVFGLEARL